MFLTFTLFSSFDLVVEHDGTNGPKKNNKKKRQDLIWTLQVVFGAAVVAAQARLLGRSGAR